MSYMDLAPKSGRRILAFFPSADDWFVVFWGRCRYHKGENWVLDSHESAVMMYDDPSDWQLLPSKPQ